MTMQKPKKLNVGSTVALVSPSWGGPALFPGIFEKGITALTEALGLKVIEYPTARMSPEELHDNPKQRAEDINDAFSDDQVDAIIASIGGDDSIRILPFLDIDTILKNPKIIMGYSDTSTLLTYLNYRGIVTFHGPTVMAGWAQISNFKQLIDYYKKMLFHNHDTLQINPFPSWSSGYPNWSDEKTWGRVLDQTDNNEGHIWLQGESAVRGRTWGGCLSVLQFLIGTDYWPDRDFWHNRILLLETSEEKPTPRSVGYFLRNLGMQGVLTKLRGILFGRPRDYSPQEKRELYKTIIAIVNGEFGASLPVVANMDFGHTDPNQIIPLGIKTEIDPSNRTIKHIEPLYQQSDRHH